MTTLAGCSPGDLRVYHCDDAIPFSNVQIVWAGKASDILEKLKRARRSVNITQSI
jgi:hypothetical protein